MRTIGEIKLKDFIPTICLAIPTKVEMNGNIKSKKRVFCKIDSSDIDKEFFSNEVKKSINL
jgi:hypothetical protein